MSVCGLNVFLDYCACTASGQCIMGDIHKNNSLMNSAEERILCVDTPSERGGKSLESAYFYFSRFQRTLSWPGSEKSLGCRNVNYNLEQQPPVLLNLDNSVIAFFPPSFSPSLSSFASHALLLLPSISLSHSPLLHLSPSRSFSETSEGFCNYVWGWSEKGITPVK